ncbi:MAG: IS701 family transposase [Myxococcales bacterium]|nr:IS701 family transposase [Myxococcales bacterium]
MCAAKPARSGRQYPLRGHIPGLLIHEDVRRARFLSRSEWDNRPLREYMARYALLPMQMHGPVRHWIIDDTGFLKQGKHSPGVQRQYTGSAGKVTNCQVAVSLTLATEHAHLPVDMDLYLPRSWADDRKRCRAAKIPNDVKYRPKWKIALDMIDAAIEAGLPRGVTLADADYGQKSEFRDGLDERGLGTRSRCTRPRW